MARTIKKRFTFQQGGDIIQTTEGYSINGEFDMDAICGTLSFNLPYVFSTLPQSAYFGSTGASLDGFRLKKYNFVTLDYADLERDREPLESEYVTIFDGYINSINLIKSKLSIEYNIQCYGTLGLANEKNLSRNVENTLIENMPFIILQRANLQKGSYNELPSDQQEDIVPVSSFSDSNGNSTVSLNSIAGITAKNIGGKNAKEAIVEYKTRYGLIFHQDPDGKVQVTSPVDILNKDRIDAWSFNTEENVFELDYGDLTSNIDGVVVYGFGGVKGEALDITQIKLKGIQQNSNGKYNVNILRFERRDLLSEEECQKVARALLLENNKNYTTSFRTIFDPYFRVGQPLVINDHDLFSGEEIFFIKSFKYTLDKNDVSCTITAYNHVLNVLPEEIVIANSGILDVDTLGIRDKVDDGGVWTNYGS